MEKDTVILSLKDYNELRDFKKAIKEGKVVTYGPFRDQISIFSRDESIAGIVKTNKELSDKYEELGTDYFKIIANVKKMSYWQFRKWRKS